jgi:hypothetical protein
VVHTLAIELGSEFTEKNASSEGHYWPHAVRKTEEAYGPTSFHHAADDRALGVQGPLNHPDRLKDGACRRAGRDISI